MIFQRRGYGHYQDMRSAQRPLTVDREESWWSAIGVCLAVAAMIFLAWVVMP